MCDTQGVGLNELCEEAKRLLAEVRVASENAAGKDLMDPAWEHYHQALRNYNNHFKEGDGHE